jgi:hypothetical protein
MAQAHAQAQRQGQSPGPRPRPKPTQQAQTQAQSQTRDWGPSPGPGRHFGPGRWPETCGPKFIDGEFGPSVWTETSVHQCGPKWCRIWRGFGPHFGPHFGRHFGPPLWTETCEPKLVYRNFGPSVWTETSVHQCGPKWRRINNTNSYRRSPPCGLLSRPCPSPGASLGPMPSPGQGPTPKGHDTESSPCPRPHVSAHNVGQSFSTGTLG